MAQHQHKPIPPLFGASAMRFWEKVLIQHRDKCWEWKSARNHEGYGYFSINNKNYAAHRIAYFLRTGIDPQHVELNVLHRCDNPPCVNPRHLFLGTLIDNSQDAKAKGRLRVGHYQRDPARNPKAKLTWEQVADIRNSSLPQVELGRIYGVSGNQVWRIKHFLSWVRKESAN